ncbi:MAG: hypothetical protein LAO55_02320 [Acidobacteriia bacterium]|nr:hypothetical protein [Terriglobia bacterium]
MKKIILLVLLLGAGVVRAQEDLSKQLLSIKRIYVDRLTGGETAAQMRDLIIASLHGAKLYVLTENPERADAVLHGAAEDLIYTDQFASSDSVDLRSGVGTGTRSTRTSSGARSLSVGVGDKESTDIRERKHEALATVRLVNKDGDVIWSTTQESDGAKFRGASADVADKIARQLAADLDRVRQGRDR